MAKAYHSAPNRTGRHPMLSQTAEYALRASLYLAEHAGAGPLSVGDLAANLEVPRNYLSKTLHLLARDGVLRSTRGKNGGFWLARPAKQIPLIDIIGPFERLGERQGCVLGRPVCSDSTPCAAHDRWKEVAELTTAFFERTTLEDLITPSSPVPPAGK